MTNVNNNFENSLVKNNQTKQNEQTILNADGNTFSTELLNLLMQFEVKNEPNTNQYSYESGDELLSFNASQLQAYSLGSSNGKFTAVIDWSCYDKILSDEQIATLSRQYGGELTLTEYAEAMKAIARLADAKNEEDEVLEEMSEKFVYGEDELNSNDYANSQVAEFMESLNFYDIDKNTEFYNSDANIFDEFKLLYHNKNYDYEHFLSLLGEQNNDKFTFVAQNEQSTQFGDNAKEVSIEANSPLNLNKYGGFSHLTPLIVQDIKSELDKVKEN